MIKAILSCLMFFSTTYLYSQNNELVDFRELMNTVKDRTDTVTFSNLTFTTNNIIEEFAVEDTITLNCAIYFSNCTFNVLLNKYRFNNSLVFRDCGGRINFSRSSINYLWATGRKLISLDFTHSSIDDLTLGTDTLYTRIWYCEISGGLSLSSRSEQSRINIFKSRVNTTTKSIPLIELSPDVILFDSITNGRENYLYATNLEISGQWETIVLDDSQFSSNYGSSITWIFDSNIKTLEILNSTFDDYFFFMDSKVSERAHIIDNTFNKTFAMVNTLFPEQELIFDWSQISQRRFSSLGKLQVEVTQDGTNIFGEPYYNGDLITYPFLYKGENAVELSNSYLYKLYIKSFKFLQNYYQYQGDRESYNGSYSEMKDLEGRLLKYRYQQNPSFKSFFDYMLNRILKIYTDHGTDPALAITVSFYIIFIFAVFYFFFPSEWDVTSKSRLISNFRDFTQKNDKGYVKPFLAMLGGFILSLINAITLSLNSFVTLGFGSIPTKGLAKYVCIIQGFIGWFLLSIFTVALINQVLA